MVAFSSILPNQLGYTLVSGDLQLRFVHVAGKGAYGIVYLAWDLSTPESSPKFLAVKCTLKYEAGTEYETLQKHEIVYHSGMSGHPNVTTLHRVIQEEYYVYFVLDYHEGGDLFSAVIDRHSFEHNDAAVKLAYMQLLDAVQACHDAGISHRDLKPENIMCSHQDSRIFLTDFGLATESGISSSHGCGSGHYMSPECVGSFEEATPYSTRRSDIWALGIILINIVAGRHPWQLASVAHDNGFLQYCKDRATFLLCILPISREAAALLSRVLDPNPRTRMSIPELKQAVLDIRTFFPEEDVPDYIRLADESFRASLRQPDFDAVDPLDDYDLIMDVPFDFPHTSSMSGFSSVPLHSPCASMFINQTPSTTSSLDTSETTPPVTPTSPAAELPDTLPHLALVADDPHVDALERGRIMMMAVPKSPPRKVNRVRRIVGAMRRVALGA